MTETTKTQSAASRCACGCSREIASRSTFAQGHDARMVSLAVHDLVHGGAGGDYLGFLAETGTHPSTDIQDRMDRVAAAIARRFSPELSAKYVGAAHTAWAKWTARTEKSEKKAAKKEAAKTAETRVESADDVKVGRWVYPARKIVRKDGETLAFQRNTKRDGSGEWVHFSA